MGLSMNWMDCIKANIDNMRQSYYENHISLQGKRNGFTMIELVFSIVIVGLVILTIPLIVRQSNANTIMSQNVIGYYNALTLMETIKSKPWDRSNVVDFNTSGEYYILNTGNAATDCKISDIKDAKGNLIAQNIYTKKGLALANKRRMCDPNQGKKASAIAQNGALESINDFHNYSVKVQNENNDIFNLKVEVAYKNLANTGVATNPYTISNARGALDDIKEIKIILERIDPDGGSEEIAAFKYYAANIGSDIPLIKDNVVAQP